MDSNRLRKLLQDVQSGAVGLDAAFGALSSLHFETMDGAHIDHQRELRTAIPEVIFARNKRPEDVARIAEAMLRQSGRFLVTRANREIFHLVAHTGAMFHELSGTIVCGGAARKKGNVVVVSAGTSDIPVAEEAAVTAMYLGSATTTIYDVGVAGIHRLFSHLPAIHAANAVIAVAGMEGALPSVLGGLTSTPIIAVPTSVGYGVSLGGLTALFSMLHSCVPGIAVMNIDNGFGAGCLAHKINTLDRRTNKSKTKSQK